MANLSVLILCFLLKLFAILQGLSVACSCIGPAILSPKVALFFLVYQRVVEAVKEQTMHRDHLSYISREERTYEHHLMIDHQEVNLTTFVIKVQALQKGI